MSLRIAIVGSGATGLTAAYYLSKNGCQVTVYEASADIGGLASGFSLEGGSLEKTYHHFFKTDSHLLDLAKELGLTDKIMWLDSSVAVWYQGNVYPFSSALDVLSFSPFSFFDRLRVGLVTYFLQKTKNWKGFEHTPALDWCTRYFGVTATKIMWEPLLRSKFHHYVDKVSMAWLWARIFIRAQSRDSLFKGERLGYFKGGFNSLIHALVTKIDQQHGSIYTSCPIQSVGKSGNGYQVSSSRGVEHYDAVLFTVPTHVVTNLVRDVKLPGEVNYLGAVCVVFSSSQSISPFYWHNIIDLDSPFVAFINHTAFVDKEMYGGKYVYYLGAYLPKDNRYFGLENGKLTEKWLDHLKKLFPHFNRHLVSQTHVFKFKDAQHIVGVNYRNVLPPYKLAEGLYLANFSQLFPEERGVSLSVREGIKVAQMLLEGLSKGGQA